VDFEPTIFETAPYDSDVLGIAQEISVLMAENLRTGFIRETFMRNPEMLRTLSFAGGPTHRGLKSG